MYTIRKYLRHTYNGFRQDKRGPHTTQICTQFTWEVYNNYLRWLTWGKAPGLDNIPNNIIKTLPPQCQDLFFLFFEHYYKQIEIPTYWKHNTTILLHKKHNPIYLTNYRPIVLANTIYKLHTSPIMAFLTSYGEQYRLLHYIQEGFQL